MCTLTYVPGRSFGFVLTTNRDEHPQRPTLAAAIRDFEGIQMAYPQDQLAGGTWIASSSQGRSACLLNGAFERHAPGMFRKSRGLVLLESFLFRDAAIFQESYDFEGIEPFTIVFVEHVQPDIQLLEFRWDGKQTHLSEIDASKGQIWSSAQLYKQEVISKREQWFHAWLEGHRDDAPDHIHEFHRFGGTGDVYNDVQMNRGFVRTVSTTSIRSMQGQVEMRYRDLLSLEEHVVLLPSRPAQTQS